jgi:hypothetical protein
MKAGSRGDVRASRTADPWGDVRADQWGWWVGLWAVQKAASKAASWVAPWAAYWVVPWDLWALLLAGCWVG